MTLLADALDPIELAVAVEIGHAVRSDNRGAMFLRLDGEDYRSGRSQLVRPAGGTTPHGLPGE
jgi:hypothetical protein